MSLNIKSVFDDDFWVYGQVLTGYDNEALIEILNSQIDAPSDAIVYEPSIDILEATPAMKDYSDNFYGGMPIQIGYCNGYGTKMNCFEYHRDSEINIAATDCVLLLARLQDAYGKPLNSELVEAYFCPKGTAIELYATTLHYAPCAAKKNEPFKVAIVLPRGTNYDKPDIKIKTEEDKRLFASNKWLIAHTEASEVKKGAVIGIIGENIDIASLI